IWLTYSVNKEDIWVSRIPLSVKCSVEGDVNDNFDNMDVNGVVPDWNIYAPQWAPVNVTPFPDTKNKSLQLSDSDPYDYAKAVRIFKTGNKATINFKVFLNQNNNGMLRIDVTDRFGNRPVRLWFDENGYLNTMNGSTLTRLQHYASGKWYQLELTVYANVTGSFDVAVDGKSLLKNAQLTEAVKSVERLSFCTGAYSNLPDRSTPNQKVSAPLVGADDPVSTTTYYIDDVNIVSK
ncbi:MAG TPA: hypothetical protein VIK29_03505, partial [Paludibacter sp.]